MVNQESYISIPVERTPNSVRPRRDSILNNPIGSFKGVNSLSRFASSYSRAQSFLTIEPLHDNPRSFFKDDDELFNPDTLAPSSQGDRLSHVLQRGEFDGLRPRNSNDSFNNHLDEQGDYEAVDDSSFITHSHRGTPSIYSYGATHDVNSGFADYSESTNLVLRKVESKGKVVTLIAGQSTAPQTIFNSVNVLIGIGLLALPLGLKHAGWILGVPALSLCALLTLHSATLLSKCMDTDPTLMTFSDLAYVTFGPSGRSFISVLFSLDLLASGVSFVVLFADSLNALIPSISVNQFKIVAFFVLTAPSFLPLSILSLISLFGIASTLSVIGITFLSGITKITSPGSLREFAPTNLYPETLADALIAIGILMAPFGGHAIFPSLKVDMRHPYKFQECLKITYTVTWIADMSMACLGFLMFGGDVKEEITKSILLTGGYPQWTYIVICSLMAIVPFSKAPLTARPIIAIFDRMFDLNDISTYTGFKKTLMSLLKIFVRLFVNGMFVIVAVAFPEFDKIIAFMGAGLCFLLCLILPSLFYLHICRETVTPRERLACYIIIFFSAVFSIVGTYAAIIY